MIKIHGKKYRFYVNNILFYIQDLNSCALVPIVSYKLPPPPQIPRDILVSLEVSFIQRLVTIL